MEINYDSVLPYEPGQDPKTSVGNPLIHRFPSLVTSNGKILPEFQEFYDKIVRAVLSFDFDGLYELSDKLVSKEVFKELISEAWGPHMERYMYTGSPCRIDIELDVSSFEQVTRNILSQFLVVTYFIELQSAEFTSTPVTNLIISKTEIRFTYWKGDFYIVTHFTPFTSENRRPVL